MSLWRALLERLEPIRLDLRKRFWPESPTSHVDFSIALIALAAKLAKADGRVSRSEVAMFRQIMEIPPSEEARVGRVFDLCRGATDGYEAYAARVHRLIRGHPDEDLIRGNLLDGLFHIAMADDEYHPNEDLFLRNVAERLGLGEAEFLRIRARHVPDAWDPYQVLGTHPGASREDIRRAWRDLVKQNHPDRLNAAGLPAEMRLIAERRIREVNRAYSEIRQVYENRKESGPAPCI
ncbi:DnaJ like chaperone protein [Gemmobacter caeni]|uniref:DnaJ like chaperone protein n=1 Tax=Gemmobacter caeni TaxID=589035 RepID=A0A2T6B973_9RHOB|nr:DnaJ family molecular chaperone [Gemmobacter caeni]PTX52572.1 DnaJ like chaperone protein [Gemmobacter caeni]TWJ02757.1 DnaJ like chaperone protein [Gemmobacter caeni]